MIRLVGALLVEINDEMTAPERRYIAAATVAELTGGTAELRVARSTPSLTDSSTSKGRALWDRLPNA